MRGAGGRASGTGSKGGALAKGAQWSQEGGEASVGWAKVATQGVDEGRAMVTRGTSIGAEVASQGTGEGHTGRHHAWVGVAEWCSAQARRGGGLCRRGVHHQI
jgi:hypothetical protein